MAKKEINIFENYLVPKHEIMTEEEKQQLLKKFNISLKQLPRIKERDPAVKAIGAKKGDIIKIERKSETAGVAYYYRVVV
ncbi:MAG: DNA-directed RNA polymerase subunit H [Candidatus Aenigmarchaeota archaeon]|nr:DNA-directed RNA polymerase subunit H [Candidatus Aenigmarchaeota archaeon]